MPNAGIADAPSQPNMPGEQKQVLIGERVVVTTDVLRAEINTQGGDIVNLELLGIAASPDNRDDPYRLLTARPPYVIQSGLLHDQTSDTHEKNLKTLAPSHHTPYTSNRTQITLQGSKDTTRATLRWSNRTGVSVEKTYTFYRGQYQIDIDYKVHNRSARTWVGRQYRQIKRQAPNEDSFRLLHTFTGGAYYDGKYNKISFEDMDESEVFKTVRGGWVAMLQHYFFTALLGEKGADNNIYTRAIQGNTGREYIIGLRSNAKRIAPGDTTQFSARFYLGPKLQNQLADIAPGLELVTDYGIFSVLSKPLFWMLNKIHDFVGNWGFAIILLTILIKLVFYKLSEASYKSMARMRKLQPSLLTMRERYKDDRQALQKAMMDFYKKEKINPLGGCLPILVQIPVFIALYWVLLESVELRQAPFLLWIQDLSVRDPFFVLPVLMGATMLIQTKLNPTPPDPIQAKVMTLMPIIFTVFFAFFPAGLVLYWLANNVLSITQQWIINKRIEGS